MESAILWALFILFIIVTIPLHLRILNPIWFFILIIAASFLDYTDHVDMPTAVFWVLLVLLLPFILLPFSYTNILLWILIFPYMKLMATDPDSLSPWVMRVFPVAFWIFWVLLWPCSAFARFGPEPISMSSIGCWMAITIIMYDRIHFLMSIFYWIAWPVLFGSLLHSLEPQLPLIWHLICVSSILVSGLGIRPDISLIRFVLWTIYVLVASPFLRLFFNNAWIFPEKYVFPYNMISRHWKISSPKWYAASERPDSAGALCMKCKQFTASSGLIIGSKYPLVRLVEWHKLWESIEALRHSAVDVECQLCNLLWHSIGEERQHETGASPTSDKVAIPLAVKIWEQRPFSMYTFAQLFQGKSAIGRRLLIHRGKKFGDGESSF